MTITMPKYNTMNNCSEDTPLCSEVTIVTVILGTPFLMKWGISLDFSSQGGIRIKGWIVCQGKLVDPTKAPNEVSMSAECLPSQ
jgi:hypothetical protein